mmetsp:Transcript_5196/g.6050  ORF Transcript_5196/g.6050 Transcript_5196/m.6050 type:complete len:240 (-) Transcript_5196:331-1050(-)
MSSSSTIKRDNQPSAGDDNANKKAKLNDTDADVKKFPHELYFEKRNAWLNENKDILGAMLIKGLESDPDEEDEDEENDEHEDKSKYTEEQMNSLRFIMLNKNRDEQLKEMRTLVLGEQANGSCMMFDTSFSYTVLGSWDHVKSRILPRKSPGQKLDILLAFTHTIKEYDVWMHDNEGGMGEIVKGLGAAWKKIIKQNSDEKLGWDTEYTKPGVMELLKQFQSDIDIVDSCNEMGKFKYM